MTPRSRCVAVASVAILFWGRAAPAQVPQRIVGMIDTIPVMEVSSALIPDELQLVSKTISTIGFGPKFSTRDQRLLPRDVLIAEEIIFEPGTTLTIAPRSMNERNQIFFIARTIRVLPGAGTGPIVEWDRNSFGNIREQGRLGKAAAGSGGEREGADGRPGADGVVGNRGFLGQDAPTLIFIAKSFDIAGTVLFRIAGQDAGNGGPGQDGGDGGPGRAGRAGQFGFTSPGIRQRETPCEPAIPGGNGGKGGDGGLGGEGGAGGDGGFVALVAPNVNLKLVQDFVHRGSRFPGGKGGRRGVRGFGGSGGLGAAGIPAAGGCESSRAGVNGENGKGRRLDEQISASSEAARDGDPGIVGFSVLTASQFETVFPK